MNGSGIEVNYFSMADGGLLISHDCNSYMCHMKEEVDKFRVQIGNQTIVFENISDPTLLRSPSAGKLVRYVVDNGKHVNADKPYAKIEVMKMIMTLNSPESGCIQYIKRPGTVLSAGTTIAKLVLDNPDRVKTAVKSTRLFPTPSPVPSDSMKLNQTFHDLMQHLTNILEGYTLPEPYFSQRLRDNIEKLFTILKDPELPLLELQEIMSVISGRIPHEIASQINQLMSTYARKITSGQSKFPAQKLTAVLEQISHREAAHPLLALAKNYRGGTRTHTRHVLSELFRLYVATEKYFQHYQYDKSVCFLREEWKDDMGKVTRAIFSHSQVNKKNQLIIALLEHISSCEPSLADEMRDVLEQLTMLGKTENSRVALRARLVLIAAHQPSYDTRRDQVESIFMSAIDKYGDAFQPKDLTELILSETTIFDVLHDFFYHQNQTVRMAALEVYIRRAYVAYKLSCVKCHQFGNGACALEYQFTLPNTHPSRANMKTTKTRDPTCQVTSANDELVALELPDTPNCQRVDILAAFGTFDQLERTFGDLVHRFTLNVSSDSPDNETEEAQVKEPLHILNVAIRLADGDGAVKDQDMADKFQQFCLDQKSTLLDNGTRRITFLVLEKR